MILITGAGGKTGRALIKTLSKVESLSAFVHRPEHAPVVKALGAEKVIVGDLRDESAVRSAMVGARAVYHVCPNMNPDEIVIGTLVIRGARKMNVDHFVYHSVLHPQTEKMKHHWQKLHVEEMIFESGLPFTILQPAPYMQNLLTGWKNIIKDGILRVPYSVNSRFSFIDLEDVAEAARVILTKPGHLNATYELAGTTPVSHRDVAEIIGHVWKRQVQAKRQEIADWKLQAKGLSAFAAEHLIRMFEYYDRWGLAGNPNVLKWLLRREPTSLESFMERIARDMEKTGNSNG